MNLKLLRRLIYPLQIDCLKAAGGFYEEESDEDINSDNENKEDDNSVKTWKESIVIYVGFLIISLLEVKYLE